MLVGVLVAVIGFVAVVLVCVVLLALFQRILPGTAPGSDQRTAEGDDPGDPGDAEAEEKGQ